MAPLVFERNIADSREILVVDHVGGRLENRGGPLEFGRVFPERVVICKVLVVEIDREITEVMHRPIGAGAVRDFHALVAVLAGRFPPGRPVNQLTRIVQGEVAETVTVWPVRTRICRIGSAIRR